MEDLYIFIIAIVALFIIWLSIGGPSRQQTQDPFINRNLETYDAEITAPWSQLRPRNE